MVTFVFTNPRHHVEMMVPVARELASRGEPVRFVSLAELRGFETPTLAALVPGSSLHRALPRLRKDPSVGSGLGEDGGTGAAVRSVAQQVAWHAVLSPRLRWLLRGSDVVVVPNDVAFPYRALTRRLVREGVPFALLQEGIRFPLPTEQRAAAPYGSSGAAAVCVWGEASAEHFRSIAHTAVCVTGNPRWDEVEPATWSARGDALMRRLGLVERPLLYLSNTVDDQGFCTTAQKMELFTRFLASAGPLLGTRAIVVKLHPREDVEAFRAVAAAQQAARVHVLAGADLFETLAMGHAAVVLASTVGLEALAFGLPLGVLALPGHGHVFEYVSRGAAIGLTLENLATRLPELLATPRGTRPVAQSFLERHLAHRGSAAARIANRLLELRSERVKRAS